MFGSITLAYLRSNNKNFLVMGTRVLKSLKKKCSRIVIAPNSANLLSTLYSKVSTNGQINQISWAWFIPLISVLVEAELR